MYVVLVKGSPQKYNGNYLCFCDRDPTIFVSREEAECEAKKTQEVARAGKFDWEILRGYKIAMLGMAILDNSF